MTTLKLFAVLLIPFATIACQQGGTREAWNEVLKPCSETDLMRKQVVYFGASNSIGPGSVWRESPTTGYTLRRLLTDKTPDAGRFINKGTLNSCSGTSNRKVSVKPSVLLEAGPTPVSGELGADLNRATSVTISVDSLALDMLKEGDFEDFVLTELPPTDPFAKDVRQNGRLVLNKALRVKGMTLDLTFNDTDALALKAKYTGPALKVGAVGAALAVEWVNDRTLRLKSEGECYIAGTFAQWSNGVSGVALPGQGGLAPAQTKTTEKVTTRGEIEH